MTDEPRLDVNESERNEPLEAERIEDPIGDETDGEANTAIGPETEAEIAAAEDTAETGAEADPPILREQERDEQEKDVEERAEPGAGAEDEPAAAEDEAEPEFKPKPRPPARLERLQKILAAAGVASRRKAEEMIEQGRVQVNGKVITEPGTKADAGRDHIRVDGKLLQGVERLRYFVLNKPRGIVTTVKDPEGRPTVMQFFDKMRERLYPVGRLDYMSEGLLLVTNDGELANRLTRAAAGVEKTYLVKVAGQPTESELDILRAGVAIEKGGPGSSTVRTSPARIRQVRQGDNPWYEVVLIEGRNRELRKMFEEIGHFVEKIRRVGYGPLVLDQEPGNLRELDAQELELLRKAAEGKLRTPKAKEIRRRNIVDSLPPDKPAFRPRGAKPAAGPKDYRPKRSFGADAPARTGSRSAKFGPGPAKSGTANSEPANSGLAKSGSAKSGPAKLGTGRPTGAPTPRPAWKKSDRPGDAPTRPPARFAPGPTAPGPTREERPKAGRNFGDRLAAGRTFGAKPGAGRTHGAQSGADKPFGAKSAAGRGFTKPAWKRPEAQAWPPYKRPPAPTPEARPEATRGPAPEPIEGPGRSVSGPRRPSGLYIEPIRETGRREQTRTDRNRTDRPSSHRPPSGRPGAAQPGIRRSAPGRSNPAPPFRSEGGLSRPFTTSSGKPRAGGARPNSKPGGRSYNAGSPGSDADSRPERKTGSGWKPKPSFGGKSKSGDRFRPKAGGFSKSGPRNKASVSGAKRSGPRPGGKKRG
jgi:23S rRNA pseudouridine2605 synthase